jgi:hypothetical protein
VQSVTPAMSVPENPNNCMYIRVRVR